jgi:glycine cleavage system H protein
VAYPDDLKYSDDHEWIRVEGNLATIGITAYAAEQVGDIVFVEVPAVGTTLSATQPFGVIESVKAVSELFAPASGKVVEMNGALADAPETVAADPHGAGWLVKIELSNPAELDGLKDAAAYQAMIDAA